MLAYRARGCVGGCAGVLRKFSQNPSSGLAPSGEPPSLIMQYHQTSKSDISSTIGYPNSSFPHNDAMMVEWGVRLKERVLNVPFFFSRRSDPFTAHANPSAKMLFVL